MSDPKAPKNLASKLWESVHTPIQLSWRQELIRVVSNRLFVVLAFFLLLMAFWSTVVFFKNSSFTGAALAPVIFMGVLGGLIGLQNRLKQLPAEDLMLLARSTSYLLLAPLVGGFLAVLLFILFISGLLEGGLFPKFVADADAADSRGIRRLMAVHGLTHHTYGKLMFWCFVAGFSERFVTNIIGKFESVSTEQMPVAPVHRQPAPPAGDWHAGVAPAQGSVPEFEGETETVAESAAEFASAEEQWQETDPGAVDTDTPQDPNQR